LRKKKRKRVVSRACHTGSVVYHYALPADEEFNVFSTSPFACLLVS